MMGSCLAGDTCVFSHDPAKLLNKMSLEGSRTPPSRHLQLHDSNSFPSLNENGDHLSAYSGSPSLLSHGMLTPPGLRTMRHGTESPRSRSRPGSSRHHRGAIDIHASSASSTAPALDDTEAFPSLGSTSTSASKLQAKKHHGKRGGHGHRDISGASTPNSSMADIVKMSPSPGPAELSSKKPSAAGGGRSVSNGVTAIKNGSSGGSGENSAAAQAIPSPKNIPWLETGERANKAYLKSRQEAIKHGGLRNKFLQRYVASPLPFLQHPVCATC